MVHSEPRHPPRRHELHASGHCHPGDDRFLPSHLTSLRSSVKGSVVVFRQRDARLGTKLGDDRRGLFTDERVAHGVEPVWSLFQLIVTREELSERGDDRRRGRSHEEPCDRSVIRMDRRGIFERSARSPLSRDGQEHLFLHPDVSQEIVPEAGVCIRVDDGSGRGRLEQVVERYVVLGHKAFDRADGRSEGEHSPGVSNACAALVLSHQREGYVTQDMLARRARGRGAARHDARRVARMSANDAPATTPQSSKRYVNLAASGTTESFALGARTYRDF